MAIILAASWLSSNLVFGHLEPPYLVKVNIIIDSVWAAACMVFVRYTDHPKVKITLMSVYGGIDLTHLIWLYLGAAHYRLYYEETNTLFLALIVITLITIAQNRKSGVRKK